MGMMGFSLLSVTVVYFAAGVVVQKFVFKKEGMEMIPNSAFWLALPGLVKVLLPSACTLIHSVCITPSAHAHLYIMQDGHIFVYRRVRRLFGGGYQQF
jgi:hypothetical protein